MVEAISATAKSAPTIHVTSQRLDCEITPTCDAGPVIAVALMDHDKMNLFFQTSSPSDAAIAQAVAEMYRWFHKWFDKKI
jgi:hypothetical protein